MSDLDAPGSRRERPGSDNLSEANWDKAMRNKMLNLNIEQLTNMSCETEEFAE